MTPQLCCSTKEMLYFYMYFGSFYQKEMQLTDEEEAIKANLVDSDPLPSEVLENIVPEWWTKEPFR